jgi:putative alpha-1,2-mannosidase
VKKVELNGKKLTKPFFNHEDIKDGGELVFYMSGRK